MSRHVAAEYATDVSPRQLVKFREGTWREAADWVADRVQAAYDARRNAGWRDDRMDQEADAVLSGIHYAVSPVHTFGGTMLEWEIVTRPAGRDLPVPVEHLASWWRHQPLRTLKVGESGELLNQAGQDQVVRWLSRRTDTLQAVNRDWYYGDPATDRALYALQKALWICHDRRKLRTALDLAGLTSLEWSCAMADRLLDGATDNTVIEQRADVLRQAITEQIQTAGAQ